MAAGEARGPLGLETPSILGQLGENDALVGLHSSYRMELSDADFGRLSQFIYTTAGIKMPPAKRIMLQSRLQKRLRALNINDFKTYADYVLSDGGGDEIIHMLDVVSTNKTDFFREPVHFEFMKEVVLPEFYSKPGNQRINVWSAGCSSGEEPYTIGIVISAFNQGFPGRDFLILGTDLSTRILQAATNAVYKEERVEGIPLELKKRYFLRSKDREHPTVRIVPELRRHMQFRRLNFMDANYPVSESFDVVFCRNVLIYFDRKTQEEVIRKLCGKLKIGGYFFLGHSESIMNMNLPLKPIKPTIFRRV